MLILLRHGQGYPKRQFERECLAVTVDGADSDGSLKAVGGTHGVSPYWYYGAPCCVLFYQSGRRSRYPGARSTRKISTLSCEFLLSSRTISRAPGKIFGDDARVYSFE